MIFKRKFRYVLEIFKDVTPVVVPTFIKLDASSNVNNEHNHFGFMEITQATATTFGMNVPQVLPFEGLVGEEGLDGKITLYDGCGCGLEEWRLVDLHIPEVKRHYLESEPDLMDVEIKLKFSCTEYKNLMNLRPLKAMNHPNLMPFYGGKHGSMGLGLLVDPNIIF
jgi:hypothetical protein